MVDAFESAGFFAAHAVWCMSDGWPLKPILGYHCPTNGRKLERLETDGVGGTAIELGIDLLNDNEYGAVHAALLYEGQIAFRKERLNVVLIEIRAYAWPKAVAIMALPFTPKAAGGFRVHKPKLVEWKNCGEFDPAVATQAFWKGAVSHRHGIKAWRECLDESK